MEPGEARRVDAAQSSTLQTMSLLTRWREGS